jgi:iron(III) transport system permease protein
MSSVQPSVATSPEPGVGGSGGRRGFGRIGFWSLVTVGGYLIVFLLLVYPLFNIFRFSFLDRTTGVPSLSNYREFFTTPYYYRAFVNSMVVAIGGTTARSCLVFPLAFLTTRFKIFGSSFLSTFAVLALLSPPFIGAYAWITMLGRNGFLRNILSAIGITVPTIYGPGGIILVFALQYYPFVYLLTSGALKTVDRSLEEAAENLGARGRRTFFRVTLPLVIPSVTAGALIAFMMSLANFGTPMILGTSYPVLPTLAYNFFNSEIGGRPGLASTVSIVLMLCAAGVIFLQRWVAGRRKYSSMLLNRSIRRRLTGVPNALAHLASYFIVGLSTLPLAVIAVFSFRNTSGPVFVDGFGLGSYARIFRDVPRTITNSLFFSFSAVILIIFVGTLLGFVIARRKTTASKVLDPLLMIPYIVPGTVLGIGFITAFNRHPVMLAGTGAIIVLTYFVRRLPYSVRSAASILSQIDPALEEAAVSLGTPPARTFRKIALPLMLPGIMSGAIMSWITSVNELSATILLYVGRTMTMPIRIYLSVLDGYFGPASAMSTILLTVTGLAIFVVNRYASGGESVVV